MTIWLIPIMTLLYNGMARLTHIGAETEDLFIALIYYGTKLIVYCYRKIPAKD